VIFEWHWSAFILNKTSIHLLCFSVCHQYYTVLISLHNFKNSTMAWRDENMRSFEAHQKNHTTHKENNPYMWQWCLLIAKCQFFYPSSILCPSSCTDFQPHTSWSSHFFLPGGTHSGICLGHLFSAIHRAYKNIMFQIIQNGILSSLDVPANYLQKRISIAGNFFTSSLKCHSSELGNTTLLIAV